MTALAQSADAATKHQEVLSMKVPINRSSLLFQAVAIGLAVSACTDAPTAPLQLDVTPDASRHSSRLSASVTHSAVSYNSRGANIRLI